MRPRLVSLLLISLLLVVAVSVTACGGDDGSPSADSVRTDVEQQADKLRDAAKSGDTEKLRSEAEKTCIKLARQIPVESERTRAIQDCRDSVK